MSPRHILESLPASIEWMVFFRLAPLGSLDGEVIRRMFHLPPEAEISGAEYVVLTSHGKYMVHGGGLRHADGTGPASAPSGQTLADRFSSQLALVDPATAICIGVGEKPPFPPVLLHVEPVAAGRNRATAIFSREPSGVSFDLLPAVGVRYRGGSAAGEWFTAQFEHRLPVHLEAGALADYSRTGHCNEFFLRHGDIDRDLEVGLVRAATDRIAAGARRAKARAAELADRACAEPLAMQCEPPGAEPFAYGDLVPFGFLARALGGEHAGLRDKLLGARSLGLWAFHTDRLITATDSALVLQGLPNEADVDELERFSDGEGGYYPQLWGPEKTADRMLATEDTLHWRQPDFATTCLVRGLRRRARLPELTPLSWIAARFDRRAGLFFANPYLTDWCTAEALRRDPAAGEWQRRLIAEILASANADGSFGKFDVALSTAFAILALAAAGYRGRKLTVAQLALLEMDTAAEEARPFYSTLAAPPDQRGRAGFAYDGRQLGNGWIASRGWPFELTLYRDAHAMIITAVTAMALAETSMPRTRDFETGAVPRHARYACATHAAYVGAFALRPYVCQGPSRLS